MSVDINISNYESYLLSFIDGELNGEELTALEAFLRQHPVIQQELDLLQAARLVPDDQVVFDNKAALYRSESTVAASYESLLLGYIDGELSTAEALRLEEYLAAQPAARKELALLQAAKLTPDTNITFGDKSVLYRHHRKPVRLYPTIWWGAAAAVVAGLIIWLLPPASRQQPAGPELAHNVAPAKVTPAAPAITPAPMAVDNQAAAKNEIAITEKRRPAIASAHKHAPAPAPETSAPQVAAASVKSPDAPVLSQLPPPRNTSDDIMEKRVTAPEPAVSSIAVNVPGKTGADKEPVLATSANTNAVASTIHPAASESIKGELIMSVSGSDSKILDKVTNVAKFFSRRKNK
ncbi:hypothetical protein [Chitinophaga vietnamensis]|uniref:hypothetical protein n=1 Tax=Chitinophaga vietnamensis TaxID=2593957 RepID=UPI00117797CD|nr:hypothetical protein [Chitinophaga vietnamensis]